MEFDHYLRRAQWTAIGAAQGTSQDRSESTQIFAGIVTDLVAGVGGQADSGQAHREWERIARFALGAIKVNHGRRDRAMDDPGAMRWL